ncbi:MAG: ketopantoate hydroxymethyltransferase [Chthonomonadaceae bacterium]|nr:ketopantoate hydroxymethyltransferase [Chthonomonadaceae bacterium]
MTGNTKKKVTVPLLLQKKERGEKIVMVTCYDYPSARLLEEAGIDIVFVGDSVGTTMLGYRDTVPVTMEEMIHHAKAVCRGVRHALALVDMPFLSYQISPEEALRNAGHILKETGAMAVKLEGGTAIAPTVQKLVGAGIPVMGHLGFTPQAVHLLGGPRAQGKDEASSEQMLADARALVEAGVFAIVLELIPTSLARRITEAVPVPTIGIGAGPHCDGQVQVFHDLFGLNSDRTFKHAKRYTDIGTAIRSAAMCFAAEVRAGEFPGEEHGI